MTAFETSRDIAATAAQVYAAIADPARLARWWGPQGFTNTFEVCEFKPGGRWKFVMHGPDGANYPNESVFELLVPAREVVIHHVSPPRFHLTISLMHAATGTCVLWRQVFEDAAVAASVRPVVEPANEQNLDRLSAEVLAGG